MACLFVGVICTIGFTLLGVPNPLALGVIAGVFEFVPLVGPLLVAVLATAAALIHGGTFSAFLVLVFLGVLRDRRRLHRLSAFDRPGNSSASAGGHHSRYSPAPNWRGWREFFSRFLLWQS